MDKTVMTLKTGWRFHKGENEEAWFKGFDDAAWRTVMVPHDWSVESPFSKNNSSGTGYLDGGIGWYRVRFTLPEEYRGKSVRVIFDGIYKNSQVWVNSSYFGRRPYGYSEISYDITHAVQFGETDNVIAVKVTHTDVADSRWFTGSGIYRKVQIVIEEPVHPVLHGVKFESDNISKASADILVKQEIANDGLEAKKVAVRTELVNRITKKAAAVLNGETEIPAKGTAKIELTGTVENPELWSVDEPKCYTLKTYYTVDGEEYLADNEIVGIRKIFFDPDKGFFLNDEPLKMKGLCVHHDAGALGAAVTPEIWQRRLEYFKKMGCNAIRCSHNPHMPELYDLCDKMGFLMMDEAFDEWEGPKNKWSTGHNVYPPKHQGYYEAFPEWHEADLRTMIRRDYNHPSVVIWSIGNELDYPNDPYCHPSFLEMTGNNDKNKPAAERQYDPNKPNMERLAVLAKELTEIAKSEDTTRPVTWAASFPELSSNIGALDPIDLIGYNYKEQFYEQDHLRFPDRAFIGTENGDSEEAWKAVTDHDFVCGQFCWVGCDFLGEAQGWPIYCSQAGYLKTNAFPKKRYYERSKYWGGNLEEPAVSDGAAMNVDVQLWKGTDLLTNRRFEDASDDTGYIFQVIVNLQDAEGVPTTEDHFFKVQVEGAGEFLAIDSGNAADLTPLKSNMRKTHEGGMVVYVRRTGRGDINVHLICADETRSMLKGRTFDLDIQ